PSSTTRAGARPSFPYTTLFRSRGHIAERQILADPLHPQCRSHQTGCADALVRHAARCGGGSDRPLSRGPGMNRPLDDAEDRERRNQQEERLRKVWAAPRGWRYWSAVNNSEVGLWYTGASLAFMLFAGVLALLVRAQLAVPDNDFLSADTYNQAYTLHGTAMMFLFAVPIFEAVAILLLPQMMSSRD